MIKISNRLKSLEKYIFSEDKVMDVGCDHAILDIYLVESGKLSKIYVCDVNPNALQNGIDNIEKHELSSNIFPVLSYGIEKINDLDVDTIVISGMGSRNIIDILSSPNLDKVYKLVLQSNNNHNELRRFLASKGYMIIAEEIIIDGKKTYINIVAIYQGDELEYTDKEYEFGPKLIKDPDNLEYFKSLEKSYKDICALSRSTEARANLANLEEVIESLES